MDNIAIFALFSVAVNIMLLTALTMILIEEDVEPEPEGEWIIPDLEAMPCRVYNPKNDESRQLNGDSEDAFS